MNKFGGDWTKDKIEILVEYAKAYLTIMNKHPYWKLLYFDGFAGTGFIEKEKAEDVKITVGASRRIVEIDKPRSFNQYYFVEKIHANCELLSKNTKEQFIGKEIHVVEEDCNVKLQALVKYLQSKEGENYKILAYIDPCGMQLRWESIACLKGLPIDMWILVPTGMGVNRLLKNNGQISEKWEEKLEVFLGLTREQIRQEFYRQEDTLFGVEERKEYDASNKSAQLYHSRLKEIFRYVTNPYELCNSTNSIMYHFFLASNNKTAIKIGNDILKLHNKKK